MQPWHDSVRVVTLEDGSAEERTVRLEPAQHPWCYAARRKLDALERLLSR